MVQVKRKIYDITKFSVWRINVKLLHCSEVRALNILLRVKREVNCVTNVIWGEQRVNPSEMLNYVFNKSTQLTAHWI